jgi:choline monooxygenase
VTLPPEWYHDAAVFGHERAQIWRREWIFVTSAQALAEPGRYVATTVAGWPVVVLCDDDGAVRAFHNVCRHRAGPLVWDGSGSCTRLVCRYHGWAYGLDGALRSARDFGCDLGPLSLDPVRAEVWRGLVFVNLDPGAAPLVDVLGDFAAACDEVMWEGFTHRADVDHDITANWKTYAENYLEGYHIPLVHPALAREIDATRYEVAVGDRWCRHRAPTRDGAVNAGLWIWRWPNLALNVYPGGMNIERFVPVSPTSTRVSYSYFFAGDLDEEVVAVSRTIVGEDRRICEAVQRNLEAGVYRSGWLSPRHEAGVGAFQDWVRAALDGTVTA